MSSSSQPPVIQGWGGATLDEASNGQLRPTLQRLNQSGYNGVRMGFGAGVTQCSSGELGSWNPNWFSQTIQDAQQYNMWIVLDYHSYGDLVDSTCQAQWLSFWNGVLSTNWGYDRIVWEPINEPAGSVTVLSESYQAWITQARTLGDRHWIAVENTISNDGCNFDPLALADCYPTVTDLLNETFLSIHPYMFYDVWQGNGYGNCSPSNSNAWDNMTAECVAGVYNQGMLEVSIKHHMPILDTEGGAVYYSCNTVCANPPDAVGTDDASYSTTTFHFIQYLTNLMQSENMGWIWWEAGEGSCCGALDTWGGFLSFQPATSPVGPDAPPMLEAPSGQTVIAGSTLSFRVNASNFDSPPQLLSLSCLNCPAGASFPATSGVGSVSNTFGWTPSLMQTGQYSMTFTAADTDEASSATILVIVYSPAGLPYNYPPVIIIPGNETVAVSSTISFKINATDSNIPSETLVLACSNCVSLGASFAAATGTSRISGVFSWSPTDGRSSGSYVLQFTVTNGINTTLATVPIAVTKARTWLFSSVFPETAVIGPSPVSVSDAATLSDGFVPGGSITFFAYYSNASCTGTPLFTSTVQIIGNGYYVSQPFKIQSPGSYQWETSYTGDANNTPVETSCGHPSERMTVRLATTAPPPQSQPPGGQGGSAFFGWTIPLILILGATALVVVSALVISRTRGRKRA